MDRPKLLILDEATTGLDPVVRDEVLDLFLEFIQDENCSIFFSSHITSDIQKIADYVILIHQGKSFSRNRKIILFIIMAWQSAEKKNLHSFPLMIISYTELQI